MNINDFLSNLNKSGVSLSSDFEVLITHPSLSTTESSDMRFRCNATDIPGRAIQVYNSDTFGPEHKMGAHVVYSDWTANIYLSEDLRERRFFDKWKDLIIGKHRLDQKSFFLGFYKDYVGTVTIFKKDPKNNVVQTFELIDAWPSNIYAIPLNWNDNSISQLSVTFSYRYYIDKTEKNSTS